MQDQKVYVWRVADSKLLHTYSGSRYPFLSLEWLPEREDTILCGSSDGYIAMLRFDADISKATGFWAHQYPVERLAAKDKRLVSGAHPKVSVWKLLSHGEWKHVTDLNGPSTDSKNADEDFIVMGIHWTKTRVHHSVVAITYMHHGIILYNSSNWHRIKVIPLSDIGGSSMSPIGSTIALSIMGAGFDLYDLDTGDCISSFPDVSDGTRTIPVLLVHGGRALFGGTTIGRATLWNIIFCGIVPLIRMLSVAYDTILAITVREAKETKYGIG
ncbi:WD40-repeat-containing domain protein [Cerioporus squamosus]|nr:WD40-repeat-containing domain protein [Cerioporus squamosus]